MKNAMKKVTVTFALLLTTISLLTAQQQDTDFMRSMGKMYVVVAVIASIFLGIVIYLFWMDRKLTKLESQIKES